MSPNQGPRLYTVRTRFRAPLAFAYAWCTDFSNDDPRLAGEGATRRVVHLGRRRVIYEELADHGGGWSWSRQTVTLRPPDRWHAEARGNLREWTLDYRLTDHGDGTTDFELSGVRTPTALGRTNPARRTLERELGKMWANYRTALERDYRAGLRAHAAPRAKAKSPA